MATRLDEYDSYDQLGENEENKESGEGVQLKRGSDGDKQKEEGGSESIIRKASTRPTFTAEHLTHNEKGLKLIYESFPEDLKLKEGNESNYLNTLIQKYKVWGFNMYPNLAFSDLLNSIEALGNKAQTRNYVADLRDRERNQFMVITFDYFKV